MSYLFRIWILLTVIAAVAQVVHDKEEASEEDEAEQAYSSLDPYAHRQHYQVQC